MAVEAVSLSMAARWRVESGDEMSLAAVAAEAVGAAMERL